MINKENPLTLGALLLGALLLVGCTNTAPSHLIFHQNLLFGADISTASATGAVPDRLNVSIGYDRQTNAIIPKTRICYESKSSENKTSEETPSENMTLVSCDLSNAHSEVKSTEFEAMSVISKSYIGMNWFGTDKISERFATGDAAAEMAKSPELIEALNYKDETNK